MLDVRRSTIPQTWLFLQSGPCPAAFNMALDEALLEAMPRLAKPVLRFYGWTEPAASFGYFQKYAEVEKATMLRPLVRRPTGGGIVPHDADWTYSLVLPAHHEWYSSRAAESYRRIHEWVQTAFSKVGVPTELAPHGQRTKPGQCFAGHEKLDLLWQGRKIAGAAQRRTRSGLLIQGSVQPPPPPSPAREVWQRAMCDVANVEMGVRWEEIEADAQLTERAAELARLKYSLAGYLQKR